MIFDLENIRNNCLTSQLVSFKTNKSSTKLIKNLNSEEEKVFDLIKTECEKENISYDQVFNQNKDSAKKIIEKLKNKNDKKMDLFFNSLLKKIEQKFPTYKQKIDALREQKTYESFKGQYYDKLWKTIVSIKKDLNKELKEGKLLSKNYYKTLKTEVGNVNLNGINSKLIESEIKLYVELLKNIENEILPLQEKIKKLQIAKSTFIGLSAGFGITAGALSIASFFVPVLAPVATTFSIASIICGTISSTLGSVISTTSQKLYKIAKSLNILKNIDFRINGISDIFGISLTIHSCLQEIYVTFSSKEILKIKGSNVSSGVTSILSGIIEIKDCYDSILEIQETIKKQKILHQQANKINKYMKFFDKITLIVVDETPQTDLYELGGTGGKNLKFKNIKTSEIFVLEDLLAKSQIELNLMGVAKVYNSKLKEWYIRTLPNKFLEDNLG
ncbi:hypothetical protein [Metamycoplasma equirhinis]|uniref:hypothetical protein n=1 Tax=Metamycoplasma equirhinis TaxID=92402 RepID=UPI0035947294